MCLMFDADVWLTMKLCYRRTRYSSKILSSKHLCSSGLVRFADGEFGSTTRWMIQVIGQGGTVFAHCSSTFILLSIDKPHMLTSPSCTYNSRNSVFIPPRHCLPHGRLQSRPQCCLLSRPGSKVLRFSQSGRCNCGPAV
jgi:hypothetical protein